MRPSKRTYASSSKPYARKRQKTTNWRRTIVTSPPSMVQKLRYSDTFSLDPSSGGTAVHYFKANSCYDPDHTGVGHQPLGFDQYMALYDHFKVKSSKITITASQKNSNASTDKTILAIYLDDDAGGVTNIHNAIEQGLTSWTTLTAGTGKASILSKSFDHKRFFRNKKASSELVGSDASDPLELAFFAVVADALFPTDNPSAFTCHVVMEFDVEFSERKSLTSS